MIRTLPQNSASKFRFQIKREQTRRDAVVQQPAIVKWDGFLGDNSGNVTSYRGVDLPTGSVVVRDENGNLMVMFNQRVPITNPNIPIVYGYDPLQPTLLQVLATRDYWTQEPIISVPPHDHPRFGSSSWVRDDQIFTAMVVPVSGFVIAIYPFFCPIGNGQYVFVPYQTIDLTSHKPVTMTDARFVLLSVHSDGTIVLTDGAPVIIPDELVAADLPVPAGFDVNIAAVRLYNGQTEIVVSDTYTDVYAFKFFGGWYNDLDPASIVIDGDITGVFSLTGIISPTALSADTNDWAPTGLSTASVIRASTTASWNLTGLTGGSAGRIIIVHNVGSFDLVLKDEDAGSAAANRFALDADLTLRPDMVAMLQYDATSLRWRAMGGGGGTGGVSVSDGITTVAAASAIDVTQDVFEVTNPSVGVAGLGLKDFPSDAISVTVSAQQDNWAPAGYGSDTFLIRIKTSGGAQRITGLTGGIWLRYLTLINDGPDNITLGHLDGASSATNQFNSDATGLDYVLAPGNFVNIYWDSFGGGYWYIDSAMDAYTGVYQGVASDLEPSGVLSSTSAGSVRTSPFMRFVETQKQLLIGWAKNRIFNFAGGVAQHVFDWLGHTAAEVFYWALGNGTAVDFSEFTSRIWGVRVGGYDAGDPYNRKLWTGVTSGQILLEIPVIGLGSNGNFLTPAELITYPDGNVEHGRRGYLRYVADADFTDTNRPVRLELWLAPDGATAAVLMQTWYGNHVDMAGHDVTNGFFISTRVRSQNLTLLNTQCSVISGYLDLGIYDLDLQGDSALDIL